METDSLFVCRICSSTFKIRDFLDRHVASIHLKKISKCYKCHVSFERRFHLISHLKNAHLKHSQEEGYIQTLRDIESSYLYHCCFCKFTSKNRTVVENHLFNEHYEDFEKDETLEENKEMSSSFDSLEDITSPETKALPNSNNEGIEEEDLLIEMPEKDELQNNERKKRKPVNHPSFPHRCARCQKRFSRSHWLKRHLCKRFEEETVEPKRFKVSNEMNGFLRCMSDKCSKVFTNRELYNQHLSDEHNPV